MVKYSIFKNVLKVVTGPTATGKTDIAIKLAKRCSGEIISADSRQIYTGMDIGTGKVSPRDSVEKHDGWWVVNGVPIHGFDIVDPKKRFSAAAFRTYALEKIKTIRQGGKTPLLVGGSWHYILAVVDSFDTVGIPPNTKLREELAVVSLHELQERLQKEDPDRWERMNQSDRQNPRRLVRAIEIAIARGKKENVILATRPQTPECPPASQARALRAGSDGGQAKGRPESDSGASSGRVPSGKGAGMTDRQDRVIFIGLTAPRPILYQRIDARLEQRLNNGMVEEVRGLLQKGISHERLEEIGLEYRLVSRFIRGIYTREEMVEHLRAAIHHFARRQLSFMTKDARIVWFDITKTSYYAKIVATIK